MQQTEVFELHQSCASKTVCRSTSEQRLAYRQIREEVNFVVVALSDIAFERLEAEMPERRQLLSDRMCSEEASEYRVLPPAYVGSKDDDGSDDGSDVSFDDGSDDSSDDGSDDEADDSLEMQVKWEYSSWLGCPVTWPPPAWGNFIRKPAG